MDISRLLDAMPGVTLPAPPKARTAAVLLGVLFAAALLLSFPVLAVRLSGHRLSWDRMADVGDAYGGASALLSAAALCGVGASLAFQQRQIRQEMAMIERQQHFELVKLGLDNFDLMAAVDADLATAPHGRQQVYANLLMNYWLSMWELGEIDDCELQDLTTGMFRSEIARAWWRTRGGDGWIGTVTHPRRRRFISIVSASCSAEETSAVQPEPSPGPPKWRRYATGATSLIVVIAAIGISRRLHRPERGRRP
ncbi:DUF6082 family protein [Actinoplanes sp. NPDC049548]|uniref:DUF6082 family protein n=1 Tax=Actinoplanes sp. NPDC049548 TaxID=3155152 RepID=UPI00344A8D95